MKKKEQLEKELQDIQQKRHSVEVSIGHINKQIRDMQEQERELRHQITDLRVAGALKEGDVVFVAMEVSDIIDHEGEIQFHLRSPRKFGYKYNTAGSGISFDEFNALRKNSKLLLESEVNEYTN